MVRLRVQPWHVQTRSFLSGRTMSIVKYLGTLPDGTKEVEVENPEEGYKYFVFKSDLSNDSKPWYQIGDTPLFEGKGLGLGNPTTRFIMWGLIVIAALWGWRKMKK